MFQPAGVSLDLSWRENRLLLRSASYPSLSQLGRKPGVGSRAGGKASSPGVAPAPVTTVTSRGGAKSSPCTPIPPRRLPSRSPTTPALLPTPPAHAPAWRPGLSSLGAVCAPYFPARHHPPGSSSPQTTFPLSAAPQPRHTSSSTYVFTFRPASPPADWVFFPQLSPGNQSRGGGAPFESLRSTYSYHMCAVIGGSQHPPPRGGDGPLAGSLQVGPFGEPAIPRKTPTLGLKRGGCERARVPGRTLPGCQTEAGFVAPGTGMVT